MRFFVCVCIFGYDVCLCVYVGVFVVVCRSLFGVWRFVVRCLWFLVRCCLLFVMSCSVFINRCGVV